MKRLTIGFVLDDSLDKSDGVQQYILTLGAWMSSQGHDVHYLVGQTARTDMKNVHSLSRNMNVRFNGNRMSMPLPGSAKGIKALFKNTRFDILHVQMPYSPFLAARIIKNVPAHTAVIGTFHIAPYSRTVSVANKLLAVTLKPSLKRFNAVVSVSQAAADFALSTFGLTTDILPNVVELERFKRAKPLTHENVPIILFLGRLVPRKGCRALLEAVALLHQRKKVPSFKVYVGGSGPLEAELKAYVAQNKLSDIVTFSGFIAEDIKPRFYASADIAVFPSSGGESFGIVLLEAMATEKSVVLGGDNPGYRSVLGPKPDLLFPATNAHVLADKLAELLTNKTFSKELLRWQNGYVPQFDVAVVGAKLINRYNLAHKAVNESLIAQQNMQ
jgi:phosphatidylinositol alpha-mannosyltransferase